MDREDRVKYMKKTAFKVAMIFLVIGALNYGCVAVFRFGFLEWMLGRGTLARAAYAGFGLAALGIMFSRDTYLPFLGETVMPASVLLDERIPAGASISIKVRTPPGAKVLYWAAEPTNDGLEHVKDWRDAYKKFENAGVTNADTRGHAILKVRPPQAYTVPFKGRLDPHVHYRVCYPDGLVGRVETVFLADVGIENGISAMGAKANYKHFNEVATSPFY